jgi:hypothetical protein
VGALGIDIRDYNWGWARRRVALTLTIGVCLSGPQAARARWTVQGTPSPAGSTSSSEWQQ